MLSGFYELEFHASRCACTTCFQASSPKHRCRKFGEDRPRVQRRVRLVLSTDYGVFDKHALVIAIVSTNRCAASTSALPRRNDSRRSRASEIHWNTAMPAAPASPSARRCIDRAAGFSLEEKQVKRAGLD
jgi:hypothetical protein